MGWKEDQDLKLDKLGRLLTIMLDKMKMNGKRLDAMRVLLDDQIKNESRAADRMADRIIEMAMVNQGGAREAAAHRRTLDEKLVEGADLWQDNPETQWPPPGHDAINMP